MLNSKSNRWSRHAIHHSQLDSSSLAAEFANSFANLSAKFFAQLMMLSTAFLALSLLNVSGFANAHPIATPIATSITAPAKPEQWTSNAEKEGVRFVKVRSSSDMQSQSVDGKVEAIRQTLITAQIAGAITHLPVQAGDVVKAGQLLVKIDARAAQQQVQAGQAQVAAAQAELAVAQKELDRQKLLHSKNFISAAQLDRAQAQFLAAQAQAKAQIAQAGAQQTQSGFYTINAPYDGIVASMPSALGEMAMPGKSLMSIVDPKQLRISANVPQQMLAMWMKDEGKLELSIAGITQTWTQPLNKWTVLPTLDAQTYTAQIRYDLKSSDFKDALKPGMFARLQWISSKAAANSVTPSTASEQRFYVPKQAIIKRAEVDAVYVQSATGQVLLRQVRLGPVLGNEREILSGVSKDEMVALNPIQAGALPSKATKPAQPAQQ
jgi:multidrug efflux system membrane fusion protein